MYSDEYKSTLKGLSDRLVNIQRPIRILDAIKWSPEIKTEFFMNKCKELPRVDKDYYLNNPLRFDVKEITDEINKLIREIKRDLGEYDPVGSIMIKNCNEYITVVNMLDSRGTEDFHKFSAQLYGSTDDAFYAGAPTMIDLSNVISQALQFISTHPSIASKKDVKRYPSEKVVDILQKRLDNYFKIESIKVELSDSIISDAAAGAEKIKIKRSQAFSERDIDILEVHEGWVHLGTTQNGMEQPYCTFLSKGTPSSTITQEGLAVIMEIFSFSSHPSRMQILSNRIKAINMAENGANFLEIFHFFCEQGFEHQDAYNRAVRVFRGSTPTSGPFTKDLVYNKGFVSIYNFIRLAISKGLLDRIQMLFVGKMSLPDIKILGELIEGGLVTPPKYLPPQFKDLAALSSWMCYSLFLNQIDLSKMEAQLKNIL